MRSSQLTFRVWRVEPPPAARAGWAPSGIQKSGGLPANSPSNPGGATPTIVQRSSVQTQIPAKGIVASGKRALPECMAEDGDQAALVVVVDCDHPARRRFHTEKREVVPRDEFGCDALLVVAGVEGHFPHSGSGHRGERPAVISQPLIVGVRERIPSALTAERAYDDQRTRLADRQHTQQHRFDQAEDGRIGSDGQGKREDNRYRADPGCALASAHRTGHPATMFARNEAGAPRRAAVGRPGRSRMS